MELGGGKCRLEYWLRDYGKKNEGKRFLSRVELGEWSKRE